MAVDPTSSSASPPDITNNNNVISGGSWTAQLNQSGETVYTSGTSVISGPVNLWNASLTITSGAVVSGLVSVATYGTANGTITVNSGGTIEDSYVANGYLKINSGGSSLSNTYESEVVNVYSSGSSSDDVFTESYVSGLTSGTLNGQAFAGGDNISSVSVSGGGYITNPSIANQTFTLASTSIYNNASSKTNPPDITNNNNVISGGSWTAQLNQSGETVYTSGTSVISGPVNLWNANLTITSGAVVSGLVSVARYVTANGTITVNSGGTIENSYVANGYLKINSGGLSLSNTYESEVVNIYSSGSSSDDTFTESYNGAYTSGTLNGQPFTGGDNISSVSVSDGGYISNPSITNESLYVAKNATFEACFLAGSLINTPNGMVLVEDLKIGDEIVAYVDGIATIRRLISVGQAQRVVHPHLPLDQAGYPVRVLKDAIAEGVPFKDLLITSEHCLFFDGKFVPARMLVNGRSIFYDTSILSYDYYHIETEDHSVVMADGMLTESYLDTGNRHLFSQKENVVSIGGSRNLSWDDAAAPLSVSRDVVEPIFHMIKSRADQKAYPFQTELQSLTHEHGLYLLADTGAIIRQMSENDGQVIFMIPPYIKSVRLVSNASRPCDVVGPFIDDRRQLGVLVGDVVLFEGNKTTTLTGHLREVDLPGWNNIEDGTMRWTTGEAFLNLRERSLGSIALMAIKIHAAGPYLVTNTPSEVMALHA